MGELECVRNLDPILLPLDTDIIFNRDFKTLSTPYLANVIGNFLSTSMMISDTIKLNFLIIVIDGNHGD